MILKRKVNGIKYIYNNIAALEMAKLNHKVFQADFAVII